MYEIIYTQLGILVIFLFYLHTYGDTYVSEIGDVQVTKFKRQIPKITSDKFGFVRTCKNPEKSLSLNSKYNLGKYYNRMPVIDLIPPTSSSKDYFTYFNRRKKALKVKHAQEDSNHRILQNSRVENGKKSMKNRTVEEDIPISYVRDHAPAYVTEENSENSENRIKYDDNPEERSPTNLSRISLDGDRVEFQIQGHEGPKTYIFGFDTGAGKNRQYRLEERLNDGTVKGHYGYYDARGRLRTVKYIAKPVEGYREKHHETIIREGKN